MGSLNSMDVALEQSILCFQDYETNSEHNRFF
jgi:hypothetical protein